jgi:soluble lytic murein transglycosylase-like protein
MMVLALVMAATLTAGSAGAGPPAPRIGKLVMPADYWTVAQAAGSFYHVDPYLIAAVMAIESRFDPDATNKRCRSRGLMQIEDGCARGAGLFRPYDPESNIWVGAHALARLLRKTGGNIRAALKKYNPEDDGSYSREVLRAYRQGRKSK